MKPAAMRNVILITLSSVTLACAACYKKDAPPVEPTTLEKVCTEAFGPYYDERKHSRYHRVSFDGYLATPKSAMISNTMFVEVYQSPNRGGKKVLSSFTVGSSKNRVERLKNGYKESDLKIESNSGAALGHGSKVKIVGDVSPGGVPGKWLDGCYVRVDTIEAAP